MIVNVTGESLAGKRWNAARKEALRASRLLSARTINRALAELPERPRLVITNCAIGYYGAHGDEPVTEDAQPGEDFLARLCVEWEREAAAAAWIHLDDWVALVAWLAASATKLNGVTAWNATAPEPVTNAEFSRILGRVLHRPAIIPVPELALRVALGEFSMFLTTGARVLPARAEHAGFGFRHPRLEPALRDLLP